MSRTRTVLMASVVIALGSSSFAVAQKTGNPVIQGERNGTTRSETEIVSNINATTGKKGGYSTRQSNKSSTGGGAIYGCRASSAAGSAPCVRANNLSSGRAFEFNTTAGPSAGTITVGTGGDATKPFTTNATGVADGLNADRVDGASATQLRTRWLLVNAAGEIERQSGGFRIVAAYPANPDAANGNVYIDAGEDLTDNGINATIALQNTVDQRGGTMNGTNGPDGQPNEGDNLEFSGEISATQCQLPGIVNCAPEGARNPNSFVVSPRLSNGERTTNDTRKRFYVMITE